MMGIILPIAPVYPLENKINEIQVGTMDVIRNLNPYLAQSEIELALQKVVFPPLIADFIESSQEDGEDDENNDSFRGLLVHDRNIYRQTGSQYLEFDLNDSPVDPGVFIDNFNRIKSLGPKSNFSWNLSHAQHLGNRKIKMTFDKKFTLGKLIAASFPLVDFNAMEKNWERSDFVFITNEDTQLLKGYSPYQYSGIDPQRSIITLSPRENRQGKKMVVKTLPDYKQLVDRLNANELQVAFNLSALTDIHNPEIALDDMKFANQYVLFMVVTTRGKGKGLDDMEIVNHIRTKFNDAFAADKVLYSSGNIFKRDGYLLESIQLPRAEDIKQLEITDKISLLYYRNTINDRVKNIVEGIIKNMGYPFRAVAIDPNTSRDKINENDFDMVIKSSYIQFPEFLNLRYYKEYMERYPALQARGYEKSIHNLLSRGGKLSSLHEQAQKLERSLLKNLPIVFFLRYNTRIAVKKGIQKYNSQGVPFFFYNLSKW
jgi:hypothetical protein